MPISSTWWGGNNYSTEEQVVGTWIDGKPIYQKIVSGITTSTAGTQDISLNVSIQQVIDFRLLLNYSSGATHILNGLNISTSSLTSGSISEGIKMQVHNNTHTYPNIIRLSLKGSTYLNIPFYAFVQYTKTTD